MVTLNQGYGNMVALEYSIDSSYNYVMNIVILLVLEFNYLSRTPRKTMPLYIPITIESTNVTSKVPRVQPAKRKISHRNETPSPPPREHTP